PEASSQSWSRILDLGHDALPEIDLSTLPASAATKRAQPLNEQTAEVFEEESKAIAATAPPLAWRTPSTHDRDRTEKLEVVERSLGDAFQFVLPIAGGRIRGIILHKLMEEFLTEELGDADLGAVEARAADLLLELKSMEEATAVPDPDPREMARTAMGT